MTQQTNAKDTVASILGGHWSVSRNRYERPVDEGDEDITSMIDELLALEQAHIKQAYTNVLDWIATAVNNNLTPNRTIEAVLLQIRKQMDNN